MAYGAEKLKRDIALLEQAGANVGSIGGSLLGRPIPYVSCGSGRRVFCVYCTHAREHITSALAYRHMQRYMRRPVPGFELVFVPMHNIDGVQLCQQGLASVPAHMRARLARINGGIDFSLWKANAAAVDLNVNFPAKWGSGTSNVFEPAPENYVGPRPLSEPENRALTDFIMRGGCSGLLSFHCKGEILFWKFGQRGAALARDRMIAGELARESGYQLVSGKGSAGGLKDWCVQALGVPAVTVEVGSDDFSHPLPYSILNDCERRTAELPLIFCRAIERYGDTHS